jgi:hypothetical protein
MATFGRLGEDMEIMLDGKHIQLSTDQVYVLERHFVEYGPSQSALVFLRKKAKKDEVGNLLVGLHFCPPSLLTC